MKLIQLKLKLKKPYLKFIRAPKHAYMAERYIRTIKTKLAEYSRQAGLHIQKSWKKNLFFLSLCHPQATHECPQKISANSVQSFGRL